MSHKNRLNIISAMIVFFLFSSGKILGEGTKEMSPTAADSAMLHANASGFGDFASYVSFGTVSSLNIRIKDFTNDSVYIGLSAEHNDFGFIDGVGTYAFRILDPTGAVAFGPFTIGTSNDNATSWALASNGPDVNGMGGYSTNTTTFPYSRFKPTMNGDYILQFDDGTPFNIVNILWFDFTVRSSGVVKPGRLWSRNWAIRTPPFKPIHHRNVNLIDLSMACFIPIPWMVSYQGSISIAQVFRDCLSLYPLVIEVLAIQEML